MKIMFLDNAWEDYLYWQQHDKKMLQKINQLIKEIQRTPFAGIGKPEPLQFKLSGCWSRRLSYEHRLVYKMIDNDVVIMQCRFHY
jgi:toxin YoeB